MITKEKFQAGWSHFCKHINFGQSNLDAISIQFMNEMPGMVGKVLEVNAELLEACKNMLASIAMNAADVIGPNDPEIVDARSAIAKAEGK
ncbi:MAG: hypothetical protein IMZ53_14955 [Thermoplasmata archaeon]|nr:hypothetical protein [Thermoplasmata archaeon]